MNYEKFKGGKVAGVVEHNGRTDKSRPHNHSNEEIDPTRSHLNYDLLERENGMGATAFFNQEVKRIKKEYKEQHGKALRKDAVTLCSWVVTLPKDFEGDERAFFESCVDFFKERYPECIPVTATVHKDETSPHLHYSFIPIQEGRLCAKNLETPTTLKKAHQELQKHLQKALDCECHILNGATDNGNQTILQLKNKELQAQVEELQAQIVKFKETRADEVGRIAKAFQFVVEKVNLGHKLNPSEMQMFEKTAEIIEQLKKIQTEAEQAKKLSESHEKALQERENNFDNEVQAKAQELSKSLTADFNRRLQEIDQQAKHKIRAAEQKRKKAEQERDEQKRLKEIVLQQLQEQKLFREQAEQLREQAVDVATKYAYLVDEIGIPDNLRGFESDLWQQLQEVNPDEQQQQKMTDDFELI